eukprot:749395-Hanusia_phi.AAC.2
MAKSSLTSPSSRTSSYQSSLPPSPPSPQTIIITSIIIISISISIVIVFVIVISIPMSTSLSRWSIPPLILLPFRYLLVEASMPAAAPQAASSPMHHFQVCLGWLRRKQVTQQVLPSVFVIISR